MVPLCVDLDGTLVRTDTLDESFLGAIRRDPLSLSRVPGWLAGGRAQLKRQLAEAAPPRPEGLPYNEELLAYLREQRASGRRVVLATAADGEIADAVAAHAGCFDEVIASRNGTNLKGRAKRDELCRRFGEKGFDYAGDSPADLEVWAGAREAILVGVTDSTRRAVQALGVPVTREFREPGARARAYRKALRPYQWTKNLLLFVPLILAHRMFDAAKLASVLQAFAAFSLAASAIYVVNDLLDIEFDRLHPSKRRRPFASGALSIRAGIAMVPLLLAGSFAASWGLPGGFFAILTLYLIATTAYSVALKRMAMLDVLTLALLYTLRVIAGGVAAGVRVSPWLLGFSIFIFFSLSLVKRVSEIRLREGDPSTFLPGRGYRYGEHILLSIMGVSSGYLASLVLALYVQSPEVARLYAHPEWLWPSCPVVLFWVSRVWLLASRGEMPDDPILFALRDRVSYATLACMGLLIAAATRGFA